MLRSLEEKVQHTRTDMKCKKMEILRKQEMLEIKNIVTEMKNALMDWSVHWIQPRKEFVSLKIGQQKHP